MFSIAQYYISTSIFLAKRELSHYTYSMNDPNHTTPRSRLTAVIRTAGDVIDIAHVATTLAIPRTVAAKLLSRWAAQGWLRRVGPGLYVPVQLALQGSEQVLEDPWVLVPALFDPAYVGGRTAAEHWGLTEQVFRDIQVYTGRPVRRRTARHHGTMFTVRHLGPEHIFGTKVIWRSQTRVMVSDIHRTLVDLLDDPAAGGGIQHVVDCFTQYLSRADNDPRVLVEYADRLGNGAVFKRLGFIAERHPRGTPFCEAASERLTEGYAKLDPTLDCARLVTRWRLWVPDNWATGDRT